MTILEYLMAKSSATTGTVVDVLRAIGLKSFDAVVESPPERIREIESTDRVRVIETPIEKVSEVIEIVKVAQNIEIIKER